MMIWRYVPTLLLFILAMGAAWGVAQIPTAGKTPTKPFVPAKVDHLFKESDANVITLTPEAKASLAMEFAVVERRPMLRLREYGGEVMTPIGASILVSAPLGGILKAPSTGMPQPGQSVKVGQPIFSLAPLLTPEAKVQLVATKIEADGQVRTSETQLEAAQIAFDRAKKLLESQAGSQRQLDEARAQVDLAKKAVEASTARRDLMNKVVGTLDRGTAAPIVIEAPEDGVLKNISALPGQFVPAGAALFEVVQLDHAWVRVPIYVGDLPKLDLKAGAKIIGLGSTPRDRGLVGKPVPAPPSANAIAGTVDAFFEFDNRQTHFSPGHRVIVRLPLQGEADSLTVPSSAILYDVHGNTWLYEKLGDLTFARKRVGLRYVVGDRAVLASGPSVGTNVVSAGAAELFGTETGFSK